MAVHEKKESFKEHNDRGSILLAFYFVLTLLIPNLVLLYTEPYSIWSAEASLFIPMGFYLMWSAVLKRSGIMIWLAFPLRLPNRTALPVRQFDHRNGYVHQPADDQSGRGWRAALKHLSIDHHRLRHLSAATLVRLTRHRTKALSFENGPQEYRPDRTLVLHSRRVVPGPGL